MQISCLPSLRGVITTFIPFALKVCEGIALKVWEGEGTGLKVCEGKILLKRLMKVLPYSSIVASSWFENVLHGECNSG